MNRDLYENLLEEASLTLCEERAPYQKLKERHLHVLWYEQLYFENLKTSTGEVIEVLSPGIWNCGSGPDFMKAQLRIGGKELHGDIEIDFSDDLWNHHGHSKDARYNHVILHLSFSPQQKDLYTAGGVLLKRAYLEESLSVSISEVIHSLDLDLYPYKEFVGSGKCASKLFSQIETEEVEYLFESASRWRLKRKLSYLRKRSPSEEEIIPSGIALALGYRHNSEAFLELFQELLPYRDLGQEELLAIAMGMSGFFEKKYHSRWKESEKYQKLNLFWKAHEPNVEHQAMLRLDRIRPVNHPIRRLVYMSYLLTTGMNNNLTLQILHTRKPLEMLLDMIPDYEDDYWNRHYAFELEEQKQFLKLAGKEMKMRIIINTFLPYIYQFVRMPEDEVAFWRLYRTLTSSDSGKKDYLRHRFFGDGPKGKSLKRSVAEQGAFQIHHDFCVHYESSCEGCPFVERYKKAEK